MAAEEWARKNAEIAKNFRRIDDFYREQRKGTQLEFFLLEAG